MTTVRNSQAFMTGIAAVAPVGYITTDASYTLVVIGYTSSATAAQQAAGNAYAASYVDPPVIPSCEKKRIVQAMFVAGTLPAFITAIALVKATDQQRWLTYNIIRQDNPVFARICAKALPAIDPVATFTAALALPAST